MGLVLPLLLPVAACQHAGPSAVQPAPAPAMEPLPPPAPRKMVRAVWAFHAGDTGCRARASGADMSLTVMVRRTGPIRLSIAWNGSVTTALSRTVPVRFTGASGRWNVHGVRTRRSVEISLPLDDVALGRVLVLLNGGTLDAGGLGLGVPSLRLPVAGDAGQRWFQCARDQLI